MSLRPESAGPVPDGTERDCLPVSGRRAGVLDSSSADSGAVALITLLQAPLRREAHHASTV